MCSLTDNMYDLVMLGASRKLFLTVPSTNLLDFVVVRVIRTWISENDTFNISFVTVRLMKVYFQLANALFVYTSTGLKYMIIRNDCRGFNNLSYTIRLS